MIGKYTVRPMDGMGLPSTRFRIIFSIAKLLGPFGCHCLAGSKGEDGTGTARQMHREIRPALKRPSKGNEKVFQTSIFRCYVSFEGR